MLTDNPHVLNNECVVCGAVFETYKSVNHKRCSTCRRPGRPHTVSVLVSCQTCGKEIRRIPGASVRFFCSQKCAGVSKRGEGSHHWKGPGTFRCLKCGASFHAKQSKDRKYCSLACANASPLCKTGRKRTGRVVACEVCGKEVYRPACRLQTRQFCSRACRFKGLSGPGASNWQGGVNVDYGPNWKEIRKAARKRFKNTCQVCGATKKDLGQHPDVHHKQPVKSFNGDLEKAHADDNLTMLCRACHQRDERNFNKRRKK